MVGRYDSVKQAALRGHKRQRPGSNAGSKRAKTKVSHQTNDRVRVEEDFEVVHSRDGRINSHGAPVASQRSPQKGRIAWTGKQRWSADEIGHYGLDSMPGRAQEMYDDLSIPLSASLPKSKKKRSKKSVRILLFLLYSITQLFASTETNQPRMVGKAPYPLPRRAHPG